MSDHIQKLRRSLGLPDQQRDTGHSEPSPEANAKLAAYWERVNSETVIRPCTEDMLLSRLVRAKYVIDADNKDIVRSVVGYFAGREDCGLNLKKGIALIGPPGVGKTMLMRLMMFNSHNPFCIANCFTIADSCEQEGSEGIATYFRDRVTSNKSMYFGNEKIGICFNEFGRERMPVKYFGNPANVMR